MRDRYGKDLRDGIDVNFRVVLDDLKRANKLFEDGKYDESSKAIREMIDGSVQTLEIMSVLALVEDDLLMEAINNGNK